MAAIPIYTVAGAERFALAIAQDVARWTREGSIGGTAAELRKALDEGRELYRARVLPALGSMPFDAATADLRAEMIKRDDDERQARAEVAPC